MLTAIIQLGIGLGILSFGGHYLVEGAVRIALMARLSPGVIGLTIVAMGTSMPELAVSLGAAARGASDVAYGNVTGSNIFNIAFILGLTALLKPIATSRQTVRLEYPFMVIAMGMQLLLARDGVIDRVEGLFFFGSMIAFIWYLVRMSRVTGDEPQGIETDQAARELARVPPTSKLWAVNIGRVALGIVGLAGGAELMVRGAITIAEVWGISERVIGLTIIAVGTSLPELATSIVAARKGESEIALGNLVGSNIFNTLAILGITASLVDVPVHPAAIQVDNWMMLGVCAVLFPIMRTKYRIGRMEGGLLLVVYGVYVGWLVMTG